MHSLLPTQGLDDPKRLAGRGARLMSVLASVLIVATVSAALGAPPAAPSTERLLFVPLEDIPILMTGANERVFMTQEEFRNLEEEARRKPPESAPRKVALLAADYTATIEDNLAIIEGSLELDVMAPGLQRVILPMAGVQIRSARLDDRPAALARGAKNNVFLFVRDKGRHRLQLTLLSPVTVAAARQSLKLQLTQAGTTSWALSVPGNVEVKQGASVITRTFDAGKNITTFQLVVQPGTMDIAMSLNNRRLREDRVVTAHSVIVSELTTSYERLHATAHFEVLHGAVENLTIEVPSDFQVTDVVSPRLSQWIVKQEDGANLLELTLREAIRDTESVTITATRAPIQIGAWQMPVLQPREVAGHAAVVGLLAEARLRPLNVNSSNMIQVDTNVLRTALPASVLTPEPGAPLIRPLLAFYAPGGVYELTADLEDPKDTLRVAMHLMLALDEQQQTLRGGFTLTPEARKRSTFAFQLPVGWQLKSLTTGKQTNVAYQRFLDEGKVRYVVTLPKAISPGSSETVYFQATFRSPDWLDDWTETNIVFPAIRVENAHAASGAVAVQGGGDLVAIPQEVEGLTPLDSSERSRFGLSESNTELTYEFQNQDFSASFQVRRTEPRLTSRNFSFFSIKPGVLAAHYELVFLVDRARARRLQFLLPATTPTTLSVRGLDQVALKEYTHEQQGDQRVWTVLLAEAQSGSIRLAVDFEQRLDDPEPKQFTLPSIATLGSAYQTAMVALEGDPDLDIAMTTGMRRVDIGELVEADYSPGRRLLGSYASTGREADLKIDVTRRALRPLPPAIVKRAELVTLVSSTGVAQSAARYELQTKIPFLAIRFPEDAELWSVTLNDQPIKPRRRGNQILLSLQTRQAGDSLDVRVTYQTQVAQLRWLGRLRAPAPQLWLTRDEKDAGQPVPQVDLIWHVHLPSGYRVSRNHGTVFPTDLTPAPAPLKSLARAAFTAGGGRMRPPLANFSSQYAYQGGVDMEVALAETATEEDHYAEYGDEAGSATEDSAMSPEGAAPADEGMMSESTRAPARRAEHAAKTVDALKSLDARRQSLRSRGAGATREGAPPASPPASVTAGMRPQRDKSPALPGVSSGRSPDSRPSDPFGGESSSNGGSLGGGGGGGMGGAGGYAAGQSMFGSGQTGNQGPGLGSGADDGRDMDGLLGEALDAKGKAIIAGKRAAKYWALQGLRGLSIRIDQTGEGVTFISLGTAPELNVTVVQQERLSWLAWTVVSLILAGGLLMSHSSIALRVRGVIVMVVICCGLPIIGGPFTEFTEVLERALLATLCLVPIWVALAFLRRLGNAGRWLMDRAATVVSPGMILLAATASLLPDVAGAQDLAKILQPLIEETKPVKIPEDALVVPYDANDVAGRQKATNVLVPYPLYEKLWNQAHPDAPLETKAPKDFSFSFAGSDYEVTLQDDEHLEIKGWLEVEVFGQEPTDVPLVLSGGMITSAQLDGEPARLKTLQPAAPNTKKQAAQQRPQGAGTLPSSLLALVVSGKGRHRLELTIRISVARQGGWRRVQAVLPHAEATGLQITVPTQETYVRRVLQGVPISLLTDRADQRLPAALEPGGKLDLQWRARVTPSAIDQALTAESAVLADLREDGVQIVWQLAFRFGQTERGTFEVQVPKDYLVEKIEGKNVRGWDVVEVDDVRRVTIELLKAVKQQEQVILYLSRRAPFTATGDTSVTLPNVTVPGAALHRGAIQIRRSSILEVKTTAAEAVERTDSGSVVKQFSMAPATEVSPLGLGEYQAYEFKATPFRVQMTVTPVQGRKTAEVRTIFRIGETESELESEVRVSASRRPLYVVRVAIPKDLKISHVASGGLSDWSLSQRKDQRILTCFFSAGRLGLVPVSIRGTLSEHTAGQILALPQLSVLDVNGQSGTIVVQVDPSLQARATDLKNCRNVLLNRVTSWLTPAQRPLARLAIAYSGPIYSGSIQTTPREARIICESITNVRVTFREIQETVLLDFDIQGAGVRRLAFRLPISLLTAQIQAPLIRQRTVTPGAGGRFAVVSLDLQDAITGQYRVVVEHDRAITPGRQLAPLPMLDDGTLVHRYVTLENAGRDEIVVDGPVKMESVNRQSKLWQQLATRLSGGDFTTAYATSDGGAEPEFGYSMKQRQIVETAGARIGLARTDLVVDESGAYRAALQLKVDNRTEPYLEVELPEGATLWTAHVAGRPVKPARTMSAQNDRLLRIPLIKTAEGDLDYPVLLKYAGVLVNFGSLKNVDFPVIRTVNIHVELSQIRLYLPDSLRWFQFDGTATQVSGEQDFVAGYVAYRTQQVERLAQIIRGSNEFSKSRAISNVRALSGELSGLQSRYKSATADATLQLGLASNEQLLEQTAKEIEDLEKKPEQTTDNRARMNSYFLQQKNSLSRNSVTKLGDNFSVPRNQPTANAAPQGFSKAWFGLESETRPAKPEQGQAGQPESRKQAAVQLRLADEQSQRAAGWAELPEAKNAAQKVFQTPNQQDGGQQEAQRLIRKGQAAGTRDELNRAYAARVAKQAQSKSELQTVQPQSSESALGYDDSNVTRGESAGEELTEELTGLGLASLDFQLPVRGTVFYFTTPRGDVEISARAVDNQWLQRGLHFGGLLVVLLAGGLMLAVARRVLHARRGRILAACGAMLIGLISLLTGILPIFGLVMIMAGVMLLADRGSSTEPVAA